MKRQRPRALLLTHRFPYPPDKGDKIRSWHLLKFLAERYDLALGTFMDDPADAVHRSVVEEKCIACCIRPLSSMTGKVRAFRGLMTGQPLSFAWYQDHQMARFVQAQREAELDLEVYFSGAMTIYARGATAPQMTDLVDADSAKWDSYAAEGSILRRWIYGREARLVAKAEQVAIKNSLRTFLVTPEEAAMAGRAIEQESPAIDYFRNGIDLAVWDPLADLPKVEENFDIVFTGAMDYRPNAEGVIWFVNEVWPALKDTHPDLRFGIIGRRPTKEVSALANRPGVTVTGRVEDMRPYLAAAKIAVAPLAIARGVQNKVLEAMAMCVPMVASSGAITGTGAQPGQHLLQADTASEMVAAITNLLSSPEEAKSMAAKARAFIEAEYPWARTLTRLEAALPHN